MRIVCFGDSNTYGYDPRAFSGGRYPAQSRWVDILAQKTGHTIINAGQNGRGIPWREREFTEFEGLLARQAPVELLLVMLGCNDLLQGSGTEEAAARMESFVLRIPLPMERIFLLGPPPMRPGAWVEGERLPADSARLAEAYGELAKKLGAGFIGTAGWGIEMAFDGVHFSEAGAREFAKRLAGEPALG